MPVLQAPAPSYVTQTAEGGWRVADSRVSLDSVVYAYQHGETVEQMAQAFPVLTCEQLYGAIAFYLRHRAEIDAYLESQRDRWEALRVECEGRNRDLRNRVLARAAAVRS